MQHKFEVRVDRVMACQAWNAWFWRSQKIWKLALAVGAILAVAFLDMRSGSLSTLSIVGLTVIGFGALIFTGIYVVGRRRSLTKLDSIEDGKASYCLTEEHIQAQSSLGSMSLAWSAIAELRRYRSLILFRFRGAIYSVLPADQIPDESLKFMIERCRASGAEIRDL